MPTRNGLSALDAAHAAVARNRSVELVTLDRALLDAKLGSRPQEVIKVIKPSN